MIATGVDASLTLMDKLMNIAEREICKPSSNVDNCAEWVELSTLLLAGISIMSIIWAVRAAARRVRGSVWVVLIMGLVVYCFMRTMNAAGRFETFKAQDQMVGQDKSELALSNARYALYTQQEIGDVEGHFKEDLVGQDVEGAAID